MSSAVTALDGFTAPYQCCECPLAHVALKIGLELQKESREEALSRVLDELRVELSLLDVDGLCQRADLEGVADNLIEQARTRADVTPTDALVELVDIYPTAAELTHSARSVMSR